MQGLDESEVDADPHRQFEAWFDQAIAAGVDQPNAFVLATADVGARPSARALLMKDFSEAGLVFYTNRNSRKGRELAANPTAAACFVWIGLHRQVRIEGEVEDVDDAEADRYFATRPPGSRLAAAVSPQSTVVAGRSELEQRFAALHSLHPDGAVDRPEMWCGYRMVPTAFEFWQGRPNRFHDRIHYRHGAEAWVRERLAP